ncbi:hypothetical protein ABK040_012282 [Willaertia magna]
MKSLLKELKKIQPKMSTKIFPRFPKQTTTSTSFNENLINNNNKIIRRRDIKDFEDKQFTLFTYNLLANTWIYPERYSYVEPIEYIEWNKRKEVLINDLIMNQPDIICLQEIDVKTFEIDILEPMKAFGYKGTVQKNIGDFPVCLRFLYREDTFELVQEYERSSVFILVLNLKSKNVPIYFCNCHLLGEPCKPFTRICQLKSLFKHLKKYQKGKFFRTIVCGDFNSEPFCPTLTFMETGFLKAKSEEYGVAATDVDISHDFKFKNAYKEILGKDPEFTFKTDTGSSMVDYIWFTPKGLEISKVMELYDKEDEKQVLKGLPNDKYSSDHLALQALFTITEEEIV